MVSLGASSDYKTSISLIERGVKINASYYQNDLLGPMLAEIEEKIPTSPLCKMVLPPTQQKKLSNFWRKTVVTSSSQINDHPAAQT